MYTLNLKEYSREEIENAKQVVELKLTETGVDKRNVSIETVTPKQIYLTDSVLVKGGNRKVFLLSDLGGEIVIGNRFSRNSFYVSSTAIVLERDVEVVESFFLAKGLDYISERLVQLSKQFENLSVFREGRK